MCGGAHRKAERMKRIIAIIGCENLFKTKELILAEGPQSIIVFHATL